MERSLDYRPLVRRLFTPSEALRGRPCVTRCMTSTGRSWSKTTPPRKTPSVLATKGPAGQTEPFRRCHRLSLFGGVLP